jgi:hypothetical protein
MMGGDTMAMSTNPINININMNLHSKTMSTGTDSPHATSSIAFPSSSPTSSSSSSILLSSYSAPVDALYKNEIYRILQDPSTSTNMKFDILLSKINIPVLAGRNSSAPSVTTSSSSSTADSAETVTQQKPATKITTETTTSTTAAVPSETGINTTPSKSNSGMKATGNNNINFSHQTRNLNNASLFVANQPVLKLSTQDINWIVSVLYYELSNSIAKEGQGYPYSLMNTGNTGMALHTPPSQNRIILPLQQQGQDKV